MKNLFHISENENIKKFVPRESKAVWNNNKYVWAIREDKIQNYLFPRECPRICISNLEAKNLVNWISDFESSLYKSHIFVCEDWKEKIQNCILYKYEFETSNFKEIDKIAGYFVSKQIEISISKKTINNCLNELNNLKVNLKFISKNQMIDLKKEVVENTEAFSIIKWNNL